MTIDVELILDDPRLVGWRPVKRCFVEATVRCSVEAIQEREAGKGVLDARALKSVSVRTVRAEGSASSGIFVLDYERDVSPDLRDLSGAMDYAQSVATGGSGDTILLGIERLPTAPEENRVFQARHFSHDGGPGFSRDDLYDAAALEKLLYLIETGTTDVRDADVSFLARMAGYPTISQRATVPMLQRVALRAAQLAYLLGRTMREGEIAVAHGATAKTGKKARAAAKSNGDRRGEIATAEKETWYREFLKPLQDKVIKENALRKDPLSLDHVLDLAIQTWPQHGFGTQKVMPERSTLKAAIDWGRQQKPPLFVRPPASPGRRKGPVQRR